MKILGISASRRKWGNTEILIRQLLQGAAEEGAETRFLRLTDFEIVQCRECLRCLFENRECVIKDDFTALLDELRCSDGLALGSPVHNLFAAGSFQMLLPRLFRQGYTGELAGKPGVALAVGGMPGWEGLALPQVVSFFLALSMPLVDRFMGYAQGPGEIFDDTRACARAVEAGRSLARGSRTFQGEAGTCPVCHCDLVRCCNDKQPRCLLCNLPGQWVEVEGGTRFVPLPGQVSRWEGKEIRDHFERLILPSGQRFKEKKKEIEEKLSALKVTIEKNDIG